MKKIILFLIIILIISFVNRNDFYNFYDTSFGKFLILIFIIYVSYINVFLALLISLFILILLNLIDTEREYFNNITNADVNVNTNMKDKEKYNFTLNEKKVNIMRNSGKKEEKGEMYDKINGNNIDKITIEESLSDDSRSINVSEDKKQFLKSQLNAKSDNFPAPFDDNVVTESFVNSKIRK